MRFILVPGNKLVKFFSYLLPIWPGFFTLVPILNSHLLITIKKYLRRIEISLFTYVNIMHPLTKNTWHNIHRNTRYISLNISLILAHFFFIGGLPYFVSLTRVLYVKTFQVIGVLRRKDFFFPNKVKKTPIFFLCDFFLKD